MKTAEIIEYNDIEYNDVAKKELKQRWVREKKELWKNNIWTACKRNARNNRWKRNMALAEKS